MTLKVLTKKIQKFELKSQVKVDSTVGLKRLQGLWANRPRTKRDLQLVRQKLWA